MAIVPPISGQYVVIYPTSSSTSNCGSGLIGANNTSGFIDYSYGGSGACPATITYTFGALPSYVLAANVTAVYGFTVASSQPLVASNIASASMICGPGSSTIVTSNVIIPINQYTSGSSIMTGAQVSGSICTATANGSVFGAKSVNFDIKSVGLIVYYTGSAPPANTNILVVAPLYFNPSSLTLGITLPFDVGLDTGSTNTLAASVARYNLTFGQRITLAAAHNTSSTTPTFALNGLSALTIVGPTGGALTSGDINTTVPAILTYGTNGSTGLWYLQNPQVSSSNGLSGMTAGQVPIAATATTVTSSKALAGTGTGITTGPTSSTNLDCAQFSGTAGQIADAGAPCGTSVNVNGSPVSSPNLNGSTPAAGTNGKNIAFQVSGSSVSGEIVGDGNATHFLNGQGGYTAPSGSACGSGNIPCTNTANLFDGGTQTNQAATYTSVPSIDKGNVSGIVVPTIVQSTSVNSSAATVWTVAAGTTLVMITQGGGGGGGQGQSSGDTWHTLFSGAADGLVSYAYNVTGSASKSISNSDGAPYILYNLSNVASGDPLDLQVHTSQSTTTPTTSITTTLVKDLLIGGTTGDYASFSSVSTGWLHRLDALGGGAQGFDQAAAVIGAYGITITQGGPDTTTIFILAFKGASGVTQTADLRQFQDYTGAVLANVDANGGFHTPALVALGTNTVSGCSLTSNAGGAWAGKFLSGTTGTCTVTITPGFTATNGFFCRANDLTTPADTLPQTATTTTTCTVAGTTVSGDLINWSAVAY
jgi:hypothetical protein